MARSQRLPSLALLLGAAALLHCSSNGSSDDAPGAGGTGGSPATGGSGATAGSGAGTAGHVGGSGAPGATGGAGASSVGGAGGSAGTLASGAGHAGTGGTSTAGQGGALSGGAGGASGGAGGAATGGSANGGAGASGGAGSGGKAAGGTGGTGGSAAGAGGSGAGGSTGSTLPFSFFIGADVTDQETQSDSTRSSLLTLMKSHGFNYIRLRTFVDPKASDGYDKQNGYDDITHTVAFGKQIKDAGMGLLVDFHYSDNWADPGKQCVPVAWQSYTTIADLATAVHDYTKDAITKLVAGGARPDMVQIGNEITPGMLIHRCDSGGHPSGANNPVTGSISSWTNLGTLLKAGVQGVKDVDTSIVISLHIDRGDDLNSSKSFITNAQNQGVKFDAFGESCYTAYQGQPSGWQSTFNSLATQFPTLKLFIAEYGPEQKAANDMIYALPNDQGIGTFNWEPTTQGDWNATGHDLIRRSGTTYTTQPDMALYDQMKIDYADRL